MTKAPWAWQRVGDGWALMGQHGMRPVVLAARGRRGGKAAPQPGVFVLRDPERDLLIPFDPAHPDARLIEASPELRDALCESAERYHKAHAHEPGSNHDPHSPGDWDSCNSLPCRRAQFVLAKAGGGQ